MSITFATTFRAPRARGADIVEVIREKDFSQVGVTPLGHAIELLPGRYVARFRGEQDPSRVKAIEVVDKPLDVDLASLVDAPAAPPINLVQRTILGVKSLGSWSPGTSSRLTTMLHEAGHADAKTIEILSSLRELLSHEAVNLEHPEQMSHVQALLASATDAAGGSEGWEKWAVGSRAVRCVDLPSSDAISRWIGGGEIPKNASLRPESEWSVAFEDSAELVTWRPSAEPDQALLVVEREGGAIATVIPAHVSAGPTRMRVPLGEDRMPELRAPEVSLAHAYADRVLQYLAQSDVGSARILAAAPDAESAFSDKMSDVIAGCVGAYGLLATNQLDRMHTWSANLFHIFPHLGDAATIHAEWLARRGRHAESASALLSLQHRRLPWFRDGLLLALDRIQRYLRAGDKVWQGDDRGSAEALRDRFAGLAANVDLHTPVLSWRLSASTSEPSQ